MNVGAAPTCLITSGDLKSVEGAPVGETLGASLAAACIRIMGQGSTWGAYQQYSDHGAACPVFANKVEEIMQNGVDVYITEEVKKKELYALQSLHILQPRS